MITYELAKQLKEAGFPQRKGLGTTYAKGNERYICSGTSPEDHCACPYCYGYDEGFATIPTLSELIEACRKKTQKHYFYLRIIAHKDEKVFHWRSGFLPEESDPRGVGKSPEEAVANLWLKLNEKK